MTNSSPMETEIIGPGDSDITTTSNDSGFLSCDSLDTLDASNELDVNFLSEFLLHGELNSDSLSPATTGLADGTLTDLPHVAANNVLLVTPQATDSSLTLSQNSCTFPREMAHERLLETNEGIDLKAKRQSQLAIRARRHRYRKKSEMIDLRNEVTQLQKQLDDLRSTHKLMRPNDAIAEWEEKAMAQRRKRRQAEDQNEILRRAVFLKSGYIANMKSMFTNAPIMTEMLNMRCFLHTYTRLDKNPRARLRDYGAVCTDAKLNLAIDILRRETQQIQPLKPFIMTNWVQTDYHESSFGTTTIAVYAFDTLDMERIFMATCAAVRDCGGEWPQFTPVDAQVNAVDAPADEVRYGVSSIRYQNEEEQDEEVVVESRSLSYYRLTESYGVLLWDFVDEDDLYPLDKKNKIKRDATGAVLVRREMCEDGVERVVCRCVCTKFHSFGDGPLSSSTITKFMKSAYDGAEICGNFVYNHIRSQFLSDLMTV